MMRSYILVFVLMLVPAGAFAQVAEIGAFGGVHRVRSEMVGNDGSYDYSLDNGWLMGFRLTFNSYRFFGHELGYSYNRTKLKVADGAVAEAGTAIHRGFYDFLAYAMPEGYPVRVFGAGGVHFGTYAWPGYSAAQGGGSTKFGINYGGGIKLRLTPIWGIRLDARDYYNPKPFGFLNPQGWTHDLAISAGFSLML
jgi:hypothetical protein